ncbi:MAG: SLC13 family permease, partial [Salinivenus sp.]
GITVALIVTEWFRIDLVAIIAMLSLVWTGSISPEQARSGFSSNAVWAVIGVMIMGRGLSKAGITETIAQFILQVAGRGRRRILSTVSLTVGVMSGFMQNIGAAALFLPVMMGISKREQIPISGLLMPMGFAALLGGTLTMVGTSSLIILNDLLSAQGIDPYGLFAVTPIGIALLTVGIAYSALLGPSVFPYTKQANHTTSPGKRLLNVWGLSDTIYTFYLPPKSPLVDRTIEESEMGSMYNVNLLRVFDPDGTEHTMWDDLTFNSGQTVVVQGGKADVQAFARDHNLELREETEKAQSSSSSGYLEVVIPARSNLVGRTLRDVSLRETHNVQVVLLFSDSEVIEEGRAKRPLKAGDTLVIQGNWDHLRFFEESEDFIAVTPFPTDRKIPEKAGVAVAGFLAAIASVMVLDLSISIGFLTGAVAMILGGVLTIEEAYRSIEWKVIFLIAGLIPIGIAMETSGAAALIAQSLVETVQSIHPYFILLTLGALTTMFALFMSNVAATVLMVPLVLELSGIGGLSSQVLVLQVGVCAANSFILPTHHVNALLMTPGGYRVSDYLKAGSILSVLFLLVSTTMLYVFYL